MEFIDERNALESLFQDVDFGEVFSAQKEKTFYLRIEGNDCRDDEYNAVNAVDLSCGQLVYFENDENVQLVNATLVIKK